MTLAPLPPPPVRIREGDASWDLSRIVDALRGARQSRLEGDPLRRRGPLPSRDALDAIVRGLRSVLFPFHYGSSDLTEGGIDFFVGHTLDGTLRALQQQARRTLAYESACLGGAPDEDHDTCAGELVAQFAARLPHVRAMLEQDIEAAYLGDPAAKSRAEIMFCYPGVSAIIHHRLAHELYGLGLTLLARVLSESAHSSTGIDIHPGADIGERFFIDHGTGVVIGETCVIGDRVRLYQGVTLGAKSFPVDERGALIKGRARHPIIGDDVVIYAGATILGCVTIGAGSTIGGNVWLTRSVPPRSQITQAQAHSESFERGAGI
ncbi:MAG: serine O-acetyltransferase EpsC [Polyangiales bacterium]